jgi:hypothetical protein
MSTLERIPLDRAVIDPVRNLLANFRSGSEKFRSFLTAVLGSVDDLLVRLVYRVPIVDRLTRPTRSPRPATCKSTDRGTRELDASRRNRTRPPAERRCALDLGRTGLRGVINQLQTDRARSLKPNGVLNREYDATS